MAALPRQVGGDKNGKPKVTLESYFAGKVAPVLISRMLGDHGPREIAALAFDYADALAAEARRRYGNE